MEPADQDDSEGQDAGASGAQSRPGTTPSPPSGGPPPPPPGAAPSPWGQPPGPTGTYPGYGVPPGYPSGYGQPPVYQGPAPVGWVSPDDRTWAMMAHLSFFILGIIGPIVIMLTRGTERPFVRDQAVEALNFHMTVVLASIVAGVLILVIIGIFLLLGILVASVVFTVMAAVASNRGEAYRYPVNIRLVH